MKLIRKRFALGMAVATVAVAACSSQHGSSVGTGSGNGGANIGSLSAGHGSTGSVGMHLTIGIGVHVNALSWTISNGTNTATGQVNITDDAGHEAQSIEFVAGDIPAGTGYVVTLTGSDSNGDPCTGSSPPVTVMAGATSAAVVPVTCTVAADSSVAATVTTGNIAVDAGVVLVNQAAFQCPGIAGVSISPAELLPPETAALTANVTGSAGGVQTLLWTTSCPGAGITNPTSPNAVFACGSTPANTACTVTLTVGLNGTGADGGSVGPVCTGVANTVTTETIFCESGTATCFPPTTNCATDGGLNCVNLTVADVNNCGGCGIHCGNTTPNCLPNGASFSCQASPPTACTTAPCTASGSDSVKCTGNSGQTVCTPTEAVIVTRDIAKGFLTGGQLSAGSCYSCLVNAGCIDGGGFSGQECGDLVGNVGTGAQSAETMAAACVNTLSCVMQATSCANSASDGISNCFCGAAATTSTACAGLPNYTEPTAAGQPNGTCAQVEFDGLGDVSGAVTNTTLLGAFTTPSTGSGMANAILTCAGSNSGATASCPQCFQ